MNTTKTITFPVRVVIDCWDWLRDTSKREGATFEEAAERVICRMVLNPRMFCEYFKANRRSFDAETATMEYDLGFNEVYAQELRRLARVTRSRVNIICREMLLYGYDLTRSGRDLASKSAPDMMGFRSTRQRKGKQITTEW